MTILEQGMYRLKQKLPPPGLSLQLEDPTKPGHRRFIALWLVDPHQRIVSTGNVPPQQQDWWAETAFGVDANTGDMPPEVLELLGEYGPARKAQKQNREQMPGRKLPTEIFEMVKKNGVPTRGLMTPKEARYHREELMKERSRFNEPAEKGWENVEIGDNWVEDNWVEDNWVEDNWVEDNWVDDRISWVDSINEWIKAEKLQTT
ncbi:hypothetical protein O988_07494 [Pseudogymnoascus sp. VKM F-3808]|nr:hypothetical protein O988_07494 [Pseudogymnoascus sp. VKM F-3808]